MECERITTDMHSRSEKPRTPTTLDDILQAARQRAEKRKQGNPSAREHVGENSDVFAPGIGERMLTAMMDRPNKEAIGPKRSGNSTNKVAESEIPEMTSSPDMPENGEAKQPEQQTEQGGGASGMTAEEFARELRRAEICREKAELEAEERRLEERITQCDAEIADAVKQMSQKNPYWDYVPKWW